MGGDSFDRIADCYDATRGGLARGGHIARTISPCLVAGPVLEVGVGTAAVAVALRELGHDVAGVDLSPRMLAHAVVRLGRAVAVADAMALPVRSASVGNVVFSWVLHVVADMGMAVSESARALRPGGRVVAVLSFPPPNLDDIDAAMAPLAPLRRARPDTDDAVAAAARDAGLDVREMGWTPADAYDLSPQTAARRLDERVYRYLWNVDESAWASVVAPVISGTPRAARARPGSATGRTASDDGPRPTHLSPPPQRVGIRWTASRA